MKGFIKSLAHDLRQAKAVIEVFYPYTSVVHNRFIEMNPNYETPYDKELLDLYEAVNGILTRRGISPDNKTAVRVRYKDESNGYWSRENGTFYIGKYDGIVSIGFSVCVENGSEEYIKTLG